MLPFKRQLRRAYWRIRQTINRQIWPYRLSYAARHATKLRIIIGAGLKPARGWIPADRECLDLLKPEQWGSYFQPGSLDAILAEHVWEHLSLEDGLTAARTCYHYLKPGGYLRIAVPDGCFPSPEYQYIARVDGGQGHKTLYTHETASQLFTAAGFRVTLLEYFDQRGAFHTRPWDPDAGKIWRSCQFDKRNRKRITYTSIILDATRPSETGMQLQYLGTVAHSHQLALV